MCVSISGVCKAENCLSVSVTDLCVCWVCVYFCLCVCPRFCVSASDRCVGSGLQSCWHCGLALLSLVGRPDCRHSRSAGTAPSHGCLSCGGVYTPDPPSAQAYRCETRSVWHSTNPQSSLQISGKYPPPGLEIEEREKWKYVTWNSLHWKLPVLLLEPHKDWWFFTGHSPFAALGWLLWAVVGFLAWWSMVLLCLCHPVIMDASVPSMSFAWQTPRKVKRRVWIYHWRKLDLMDISKHADSITTGKLFPVIRISPTTW